MKILNVDNCIVEKEIIEADGKFMLKGFVELERQSSNNVFVPIKLFFDQVFLDHVNQILNTPSKGFDISGVFVKNKDAELEFYNPHINPTSNGLNTGSIIVNVDILVKGVMDSNKSVIGKTIDSNPEKVCIMGDINLYEECKCIESIIVKSIGEYLHTPENIYIKSINYELINLNTGFEKNSPERNVFDIYPDDFQVNHQAIPWVDSIIL